MSAFEAFKKKKATLSSGTTGPSSYFGVSHGKPGGLSNIDQALNASIVFAAACIIAGGFAQMPVQSIEESEIAGETWTRVAK